MGMGVESMVQRYYPGYTAKIISENTTHRDNLKRCPLGGLTRSPFSCTIVVVQTKEMGLSAKKASSNFTSILYGESVTSAEIKAFCQMNDFNYQTVTNKLEDYKVGRGKWNLEVTPDTVEDLEITYNGPAAMPAIEQNLIPRKDDSFVKFGNFH